MHSIDGDRLVLQAPLTVTRAATMVRGHGHLDQMPFALTVVGTPDPAHPEESCVTTPLFHIVVGSAIVFKAAGECRLQQICNAPETAPGQALSEHTTYGRT